MVDNGECTQLSNELTPGDSKKGEGNIIDDDVLMQHEMSESTITYARGTVKVV